MNRRDFGKTAGMVAATAVVAPRILAETMPKDDQVDYYKLWDEDNLYTSKQRADIDRSCLKMKKIGEFCKKIVSQTPQTVPNDHYNNSWRYGDFRIHAKSGKYTIYQNGEVYRWENVADSLDKEADLSNVNYILFWKQAVRNKYTQELKFFISKTPTSAESVNPGQTVTINESLTNNSTDEEIEAWARVSFNTLQSMVIEHYNREV
jgi:hypothetical protein